MKSAAKDKRDKFLQDAQITDRAKVGLWLDFINCTDLSERQEVLDKCATDVEARAYYVMRYSQDCAK